MDFQYYIILCVVIFALLYPITWLAYEYDSDLAKDSELELFLACLIASFIPMLNIICLIVFSIGLYVSVKEKKKEKKEYESHPEISSFDTLLDVLHLYREYNNSNKQFQNFINRVQDIIDILKPKYKESGYREILIRYDFTFARLKSIIDESSSLKDDARNKVLITSKDVIDSFLEECQLLIEKENEIVLDTEEAVLNRLLSEINEEKKLHKRDSSSSI